MATDNPNSPGSEETEYDLCCCPSSESDLSDFSEVECPSDASDRLPEPLITPIRVLAQSDSAEVQGSLNPILEVEADSMSHSEQETDITDMSFSDDIGDVEFDDFVSEDYQPKSTLPPSDTVLQKRKRSGSDKGSDHGQHHGLLDNQHHSDASVPKRLRFAAEVEVEKPAKGNRHNKPSPEQKRRKKIGARKN